MRILNDMRTIQKIKYALDDMWQQACAHKWCTLISIACAVVGIVLGAVLVSVFRYSWWFDNRYQYAVRLFEGGFGLFFSFLAGFGLFYVVAVCCLMLPQTKPLCYVVLTACCFYCGANTAAAIIFSSVWGILYAVIVSLGEVVCYVAANILLCGAPCERRTLREAFCDSRGAFWALCIAFAAKFVCFFVVLRILTALI